MLSFNQPITPNVQAHFDAQYALLSDMSQKMFDTVQRINELNMQAAQNVFADSLNNAQQVLVAKDPYEALSIAASQAQPVADKVRAYQQQLADIASRTQAELARSAEARAPEASRTASAAAEEANRHATGTVNAATAIATDAASVARKTTAAEPKQTGSPTGRSTS